MVASDLGKGRVIRLDRYLFHVRLRTPPHFQLGSSELSHILLWGRSPVNPLLADGGSFSSNTQYEAGKYKKDLHTKFCFVLFF
jgi:hypothetical protein